MSCASDTLVENDQATLIATIAQLAREASIEMNVQDAGDLQASQAFLPPGKCVYVSHLPKQSWQETLSACRVVHRAGFDPIPHVPVRLIKNVEELDGFLATAVTDGGVREVLLVAGVVPSSGEVVAAEVVVVAVLVE